jgi:hypothetical protein
MEIIGQGHPNLSNPYWEATQIDSEDSNKDLIPIVFKTSLLSYKYIIL